MTYEKWLAVIGIGEDNLSGLSTIARSLIDKAEILVGDDRLDWIDTKILDKFIFCNSQI